MSGVDFACLLALIAYRMLILSVGSGEVIDVGIVYCVSEHTIGLVRCGCMFR